MNKEERLNYIKRRFKELQRAEGIDGGGVIHSSSRDIQDEMGAMPTFLEGQRDTKQERNRINSDD